MTAATDEVVELCRDLIRIDTTNTGDTATSAGERVAAEYVAGKLSEVGLEPIITESEPGRASVMARWAGADSSRGALLIHGHLDVVPADASEWSVDPFSGEVRDGYLWGRGAVDMKDFDAMALAVVRQWRREGRVPPRDIVLAFTADEEAGGKYGAHHLVTKHADLFEGCTEAIGEVGGFSVSVGNDLRLYLIETAEKGLEWMRLVARGRPGHGSMMHDDNAVTALSEAVARLGRHKFPIVMTPSVREFLERVSEILGVELDPENPEATIAKLGPIARLIGATIRHTANPTRLDAGYKENVIPSRASATIDCRPLPGRTEEFMEQLREVIGHLLGPASLAPLLALLAPGLGDGVELHIDRQTEDVVAAQTTQQIQHFRRAVVGVAAHQDTHVGPAPADARITCRSTRAISSPDGRLPGRKSDRIGLPELPSKMWIGWKQCPPAWVLNSASSCWPCTRSSASSMSSTIEVGGVMLEACLRHDV